MTQLFGIVGWPVKHSRSPQMHRAAFEALDIDATYERFAVEPELLSAGLATLAERSVAGFNVTLPHKRAMLDWVSLVEPAAFAIGAINTVYRRNDHWVGTNTDASGLRRSLDAADIELSNKHVVILGAGGAARAAVFAVRNAGAETTVVARQLQRSEKLAGDLGGSAAEWSHLPDVLQNADILVQATSATMGEHPEEFVASLPLSRLPIDACVVDLVYVPRQTALLERAAEMQRRTVDGTGMLLHQGAAAFELWTGRDAPVEIMRAALLATL